MKRREMLKLGVSAVPAAAAAQTHGHLPAEKAPEESPRAARPKPDAAPAWKPALFDTHQNDTVVALTDLIIPATDTPGAKAANVNRYIDLLLNDGPADQRQAFLAGLAWLDGYALQLHRRPFVRCTPAQQTAILEALDGAATAGLAPGAQFFRMAKGMTARIYYQTAIGFRELNKGGRVPGTFGCRHTSHG